MGFFDDADRGLRSVSLTEVIWSRPDVAPSGGLADGDGTGVVGPDFVAGCRRRGIAGPGVVALRHGLARRAAATRAQTVW